METTMDAAHKPETTVVNNPIPGSEAVGVGCNLVLKPYVAGGGIACLGNRSIFDLGPTSTPWTSPGTGTTYDVPKGLKTPGAGNQNLILTASTSLSELTENFKKDAGVGGSYKLFSAQADVSYQKATTQLTESSYTQVQQNAIMWNVRLDTNHATLDPSFVAAVNSLPSTFDSTDPQNAQAFFGFFDHWGTHYLIEADVGGKLYYFAELEDVGVMDETSLETNVSAEFKGLTASAKATSTAEWNKVSASWLLSRKTHIMTVGPSYAKFPVAEFLNPKRGARIDQSGLAGWQAAVEKDPRTVGAKFTEIFQAISDPAKRSVMKQALDAYANPGLTIQADSLWQLNPTTGKSFKNVAWPHNPPIILLNGKNVLPSTLPTDIWPGGIVMALFDPADLSVLHAKIYSPPANKAYDNTFTRQLVADLNSFASKDFLIVLYTFGGLIYYFYPGLTDPSFTTLLKSYGAGKGLGAWSKNDIDVTTSGVYLKSSYGHTDPYLYFPVSGSAKDQPTLSSSYSGVIRQQGYCLVGATGLGLGNGVETVYDYVYFDTVDRPNNLRQIPTTYQTISTYLRPSVKNGKLVHTPVRY